MFKEIQILKNDVSYFEKLWIKNKVGQNPAYVLISADMLENNPIQKIVDNLELSLKNLKINPVFPYPLYLITEYKVKSDFIPLANSKNELPNYFNFRWKIPTPSEKIIIQKINILKNHLSIFPIEKFSQDIKIIKKEQKALHSLLREEDFYKDILNNLQNNLKNNFQQNEKK
ncbi:MAG: hypothetical protein HQK51_04525 [Oligoflexia bacterium]|nr:hypothetical protein [Oligoflexia bacterium]